MDKMQSIYQNFLELFFDSPYASRVFVKGEGSVAPSIAMVGEAPGAEEEKCGRPFVGKAGKNLDTFLERTGLLRENIYITNVVKIRPTSSSPKTGKPVNRPPSKEEIRFFLPLLAQELDALSPNIIVTLGNVALRAVSLDATLSIGDCHGRVLSIGKHTLFPLYHPAAIIYNQALKDTYYSDLDALKLCML